MTGYLAGKKQGLKRRSHRGWILALMILVTACSPEGQVPQDPLLRSLERKSGLIVYVGADGNIYTIDQGGGNQTAVTTDAGSTDGKTHAYQFPTWSPDSKTIAFARLSRTGPGAAEAASIFTAAPDGAGRVEAYISDENFPIYLYWSPDGERVSFLTSSVAGNLTLQMVPAQGGESVVLDAGSPYYWSWAPNGQDILVHVGGAARAQPRARLSFLSVGDDIVEESLELRPSAFQAPAWSPDGSQLLLAAETDEGDQALMLTDPRGAVNQILALPDGSIAFGWSPDSERVAYIASGRDRQLTIGPLTIVDPDKPVEAKTTEQDDVLAFFWSPDSRKVAYFELLLFTPTPDPNQSAQAEPILLLRLYVLDAQSGDSREVTTFLPTEEFLNMLAVFDQYQRSATVWSPDSKNLALSGLLRRTEGFGIWVVAASGNLEPRYLTEGLLAFWSWK